MTRFILLHRTLELLPPAFVPTACNYYGRSAIVVVSVLDRETSVTVAAAGWRTGSGLHFIDQTVHFALRANGLCHRWLVRDMNAHPPAHSSPAWC
jgi:phosphoribosylformimino-5-aminoimidazole carboxamide ribonucleotide (ProFAR) isomerase